MSDTGKGFYNISTLSDKASAQGDKYASNIDTFTDDPVASAETAANSAAEAAEQRAADRRAAENAAAEEENTKKDTSDWMAFFKSVLYYFILTLIIGLFGSSFIYLTSRSSSDKDIMLPTDNDFYSSNKIEGERTGPSSNVNCNTNHSKSYSVWEDNFPYNLIVSQSSSPLDLQKLTFSERLRTWFAKTVGGCFKVNRGLLKSWLTYFKENTPLGNHAFQIFIAMPITLLFSFIGLITGLCAAFGAAIGADVKVSVWGFIVLYIWPVVIGLALVIFWRLIATLLLLPMLQNWKEVSTIMSCNAKTLVVFFALMVYISATNKLDSTTANIMGIVYFCLLCYTLWQFFTRKT